MIEPAVDRHRGFTAVLVHLKSGSPPSPDGRRYNRLASRRAELDARSLRATEDARGPTDARPGSAQSRRSAAGQADTPRPSKSNR